MKNKIAVTCLLIGSVLSACSNMPFSGNPLDIQNNEPTETVVPPQEPKPTDGVETTEAAPAATIDPLSSLKGKIVKDENGYLLLLGFVNNPDAPINYRFPESFQFPHEHIKDDLRIQDGNGSVLEFEDIDPGEMNLYAENPLGGGIFDPRVLRILQKEVYGPLTLEMVNLIQVVNLPEEPALSFKIQFEDGFPLGKNQWDIIQSVDLIAGHPFTLKYFDATILNDYKNGKFDGPQNTFFPGTFYLEADGFEGINFSQIIPADRQTELPIGGGGFEETCDGLFPNCVMADAGLLVTADNAYDLKISGYRLLLHGPWQVQSDLPQ